MRYAKSNLVLTLLVVALALVLTACGGDTAQLTPLPSATPSSPVKMPESETTETATNEQAGATALEEIIATRPPQHTATPGFLAEEVTQLVESTRLEGTTFLGLTADNWINLFISLLIVVIAYAVAAILTRGAAAG